MILAVAHDEFKKIPKEEYGAKFKKGGVIIDVKNGFGEAFFQSLGISV